MNITRSFITCRLVSTKYFHGDQFKEHEAGKNCNTAVWGYRECIHISIENVKETGHLGGGDKDGRVI
jgi:hypothetical protein